MRVYTPPQVEDEINHAGQPAVESALRKVRRWASDWGTQRLQTLADHKLPGNHLVFRLGRSHRLLARCEVVDGNETLILLRVLPRGHSIYLPMLDRIRNQDYTDFPDIDKDALLACVTQPWVDELAPATSTPLPDSLHIWLTPPPMATSADYVVFEGHDWVAAFGTKPFQDYWQDFHRTVVALVENTSGIRRSEGTCEHLLRCSLEGHEAVVRYCEAVLDDRCVFFLVQPLFEGSASNAAAAPCPLCAMGNVGGLTLDHVAPYARRAYPAEIVKRREAWRAVQCDEVHNLALSAEEEAVLLGASGADVCGTSSSVPPLFINGPAGSGKSTMLSYLYRAYCLRSADVEQYDGADTPYAQLLYLTWSDRLLERAREATRALLVADDRGQTSGQVALPSGFDASFKSYHAFMLSLLPAEERRRFSADRRIDFTRFRRLYGGVPREDEADYRCKLVLHPRYSPDITWHVISNLIKGYFPDDTMDPDDYAEVPLKDRTVSLETFAAIYKTVWAKWYEALGESEWWDDRDLARRVLAQEDLSHRYIAIFCDEAQDFTRVELKLLMLVSAFSRYALPHNVSALPFVFAGDPLQTISPTGFRWKSLTAAFHDELIQPLAGRSALNLGETELSYNYRSTRQIVKVGNLLQLWRRAWLDLDVKPQKAWHPEGDEATPVLFVLGRNLAAADFVARTNNTTIIVPCELDEERSYCEEHEALAPLVPQSGDGLPPTVQSPARVKGREFDRVVVYGFGDAFPDVTWPPEGDDARLQLEHRLNNLYVALTRAKKELFVVDTEEGYERLWRVFASEEGIAELLEALGDERVQWIGAVGTLTLGSEADSGAMGTGDAKTQAMEYERQGRQSGDADLLRRAYELYLRAGETAAGGTCLAEACELDGEYQEAGDIYQRLQRHSDAVRCFWRGAHWSVLDGVLRQYPQAALPSPLLPRMVEFVLECDDSVGELVDFLEWANGILSQGATVRGVETQWRSVARALTGQLRRTDLRSMTPEQGKCTAQVMLNLYKSGVSTGEAVLLAARCYCAAGMPEAAAGVLEEHGMAETDDYFRARAQATPMPDRLVWLDRFSDRREATDSIVAEWEALPSEDRRQGRLEPASAQIVGLHLESRQRWHDALVCYVAAGDADAAVRSFKQVGSRGSAQHRWKALNAVVALLSERGRLGEALSLLADAPRPSAEEPEYVAVAGAIAKSLARSENRIRESGMAKRLADLIELIEGRAREMGLLTDEEVGAALEMTGTVVGTLIFYEQAFERVSRDPERLTYMRQRWVAVKRRHREHASLAGAAEAERVQRDLRQRMREWGMPNGYIPPDLPLHADWEAEDGPVDGLPVGARLERPSESQIRFSFAGLSVTADTQRALLQVTTETLEAARVEVASGRHSGDLVLHSIEAADGRVVLGAPDADLRIELDRRGQKHRARLVRGDAVVTIRFR